MREHVDPPKLIVMMPIVGVRLATLYVDPGAGSLIFQVLIGGALAVGVVVKTFWKRITGFIGRRDDPGSDG